MPLAAPVRRRARRSHSTGRSTPGLAPAAGSAPAISPRSISATTISSQDLAAGRAGYRAGIDRLVAAGAAGSDRKLFVTLLTDWTRSPGISSDFRGRVDDWNGFVSGIANGNDNIIAVDLFTVFEKIYDDPGRFGFTNVSTADAGRSSTDALFFDQLHFGDRGQDIIARVYRHYLTRAWDWANTLDSGGSSARQLNRDIDNGLLVLGLDDTTADRPLGLSHLRVRQCWPRHGPDRRLRRAGGWPPRA